ncbi:MAG: FkbM family methyltransferase [Bacteroidetes bacterium]|nr:MAG: FkbM family methyltransferase [Bacteroidota bacterium]
MKKIIKYYIFNLLGYFKYFNCKVFFPRNSLIFKICIEQGIYEKRILDIIAIYSNKGIVLDVGANIGLISVAILRMLPEIKVYSFEPSKHTLQFLLKTRGDSIYKTRWEIVGKAVGNKLDDLYVINGIDTDSAFNKMTTQVNSENEGNKVSQITIDSFWNELGRPKVDAIKIDIEGYDFFALKSAFNCIISCKPAIIIEWTTELISANQVTDEMLIDFCKEINYNLYTLNSFNKVGNINEFKLAKLLDINFLLIAN